MSRRAEPGANRDRPRAPRPAGAPAPLWAGILLVLVLVQITLVTFLPLTRAVPDLVLVTVLALAHHRGAVTGGLLGAWAGVLLDLVPTAIDPLGGWTVVLGVAGFVHGHIVATRRPGPLLALVLLAATATAATVAHALVLWFAAVPVAADAVAEAAVGAGVWALVLAPVALLITGGRIGADDPTGRLEREPTLLDAVTPGWFGPPVVGTGSGPAADHARSRRDSVTAEHAGGP